MFNTEDSRNIWVSPVALGDGDGIGTYETPYASISDALQKATPGQTIVLMPGVYRGDLTVEISGTENSPIYITAYKQGEAVIDGGCWYFYDTSDLVVSGMTFKNAPHGALSVVGQCLRNRFHSIKFIDCGTDGKASCTFYIGGAGGKYNLVEDCEFSRRVSPQVPAGSLQAGSAVVGLMISDGADGHPLINHIVRHNRFSGYDTAVIIGSGSMPDFESGHIVERNFAENCRADGITVKCGDVWVRKNALVKCAASGIVLSGGKNSFAESNVISNCDSGISVSGPGHSVADNTMAACESHAINEIDDPQGLVAYDNYASKVPLTSESFDKCINDKIDIALGGADYGYKTASMPQDDSDDDGGGDEETGHVVIGGDGERIVDGGGYDDDDTCGGEVDDYERDEYLSFMFNQNDED